MTLIVDRLKRTQYEYQGANVLIETSEIPGSQMPRAISKIYTEVKKKTEI